MSWRSSLDSAFAAEGDFMDRRYVIIIACIVFVFAGIAFRESLPGPLGDLFVALFDVVLALTKFIKSVFSLPT